MQRHELNFVDLRTVLEFSWWVDSKTVLDFEIQRRIDWDIQGQRHGITSFLQNPQKLFYAMESFLINIYIYIYKAVCGCVR